MVRTYKGRVIRITGTETTRNQWELRVSIIWPEGGVNKIKTFTVTRRFHSYDQAVTRGLVWAKEWIDAGKPNHPLRSLRGTSLPHGQRGNSTEAIHRIGQPTPQQPSLQQPLDLERTVEWYLRELHSKGQYANRPAAPTKVILHRLGGIF
jgi:hypothetical protein